MWIENWNYIEQDGINELNNSLSDINTGTTRWLGQVNQEINNSKYNLDRDINPELDDFLSDWKLDKGEIKALTEIFEHNKTWVINISKKNLEWLRLAINSTKEQNYVWNSEKELISTLDWENEENIINIIQSFESNNLEDSFIKLKKLDDSIENIEDISDNLKKYLLWFLNKLKEWIGTFRWLSRIPSSFERGINDLLWDSLNNKWLFNIDDIKFKETLSKIIIEKERVTWEKLFDHVDSDFLLTIEKLDESINSNSKVVLIWINDYKYSSDLEWTINDIDKMKKYIIKIYWIPEKNIILIKNKDATKENILKKIELSSKDSKWGTLVYYSWHWTTLNKDNITENKQGNTKWLGQPVTKKIKENNEAYIVPVNADKNNLHINNFISAKELSDALHWKWLVITDMCESWKFIKNLDSDINWVWATSDWLAWERYDDNYNTVWKFSYNFSQALLNNNWNINESLFYTTLNTPIQKEVFKVWDNFYKTK